MPDGRYLSETDYQIFLSMKADYLRHRQHFGNPGAGKYLADPDAETVKLKITSVITGQGGRYNAKLISDGVVDISVDSTDPIAVSDLGAISSDEDLIVWNLSEIGSDGHSINLSDDSQCTQMGIILTFDEGKGKYIVAIGGTASAPGCFLVYLNQNGGSNGNDATVSGSIAFPTYTYDVFSDSGLENQIGTAVSVIFHRLAQIAVEKGTHGLAIYSGSTLLLLFVDEYLDRGGCPS